MQYCLSGLFIVNKIGARTYIDMNPHIESAPTDVSKQWLMCPVCLEPNPRGTEFCHHCWGARLDPEPVLSMAELEVLRAEERRRRRAKSIAKKSLKIGIPTIIVLIPVILILAYWTDIIVKPHEAINSSSIQGEWTMFGYDLGHSGNSGSSDKIPKGTLKWSFATDDAIASSPVVLDGTVYIGSRDYNLYAIDAETGTEQWRFRAESWVEASPAVSGGVVYAGSNDGKMYALDAATGEYIWIFRTGRVVKSSPAVADGKVYFGNGDYNVYCVDSETGALIWQNELEGAVLHGPVVTNGVVYIAAYGDYLYALDAVTGRIRLRFKTWGSAPGAPAVKGDMVYLVNDRGFLLVFDGNARSWPREHQVRSLLFKIYVQSLTIVPPKWLIPPSQSGFTSGAKMDGRSFSFPSIAGDNLFVGSNGTLFAIDIANEPMELWSFEVGGRIKSSPSVAAGIVYTGSGDGNMYAVEAETGEELWRFATGAAITSSPAIVDGVVYLSSHDGNLYAIE
jgi:eukaryotic-like serine/threonine-protein kinase